MFCRCLNRYGDAPNTNVCTICLAHPGMLPVAERRGGRRRRSASAWRSAAGSPRTPSGTARTTSIPTRPKAYQISQYDQPLCAAELPRADPEGGFDVGIMRAHLEEDAAKTIHVGGGGGRIAGSGASDRRLQPRRHAAARDRHRARPPRRRAGAPLPDAAARDDRSPSAPRTATWRRARCASTPTCRCAAPARPRSARSAELKNMNSFRFLERGINAEIGARSRCSRPASAVVQATLHYDPATRRAVACCARRRRRTTTATSPSPTCVPVEPDPRATSTSCARRCRSCRWRGSRACERDYGLPEATAEPLALDAGLTAYFEDLAARTGDARGSANWVMGELAAHLNATGLDAAAIARHARAAGRPDGARRRRHAVVDGGEAGVRGDASSARADAAELTERLGLAQIGDVDALGAIVDEVLAAHPGRGRRRTAAASSS